jgi:glycosyltransferase involved in cell wall biosynthesis
MRICTIGDGRSVHLMRTLKFFSERGHDLLFITYEPVREYLDGVTTEVVGSEFKYLMFPFRDRKIQNIINVWRPDVVHAHFITKYGFHLPKDKTIPAVVSAWGDDILILPPKNPLIKYYTQKSLDRANLIYAVSQDIRNHMISDFVVDPRMIKVNPVGVDTEKYDPSKYTRTRVLRAGVVDEIRVFSNRAFEPVYDIPTTIYAFQKAHEEDSRLHLYLAGSGYLEQDIRNLIREYAIPNDVTFLGFVEDMPKRLADMDIYLNTSISDGSPISLLEAMAMKKPIVTTNAGGIPEWVSTPCRIHDFTCLAKGILAFTDPGARQFVGNRMRTDLLLKGGDFKKNMETMERDYETLHNT